MNEENNFSDRDFASLAIPIEEKMEIVMQIR